MSVERPGPRYLDCAGRVFPILLPWGWGRAEVEQFEALWRSCLREPDDTRMALECASRDDVGRYSYDISRSLALRTIESYWGELLLLHGCALADEAGSVVAFVAPSGTGKSTLVRSLGARYRYVTDELVAIEQDGTIHPFPKPISKVVGRDPLVKADLPLERFGLTPAVGALSLKTVVVLNRDPDCGEPQLRKLTIPDALRSVVGQSSSLWSSRWQVDALVSAITSLGEPLELVYSEASSVGPLVDELFSADCLPTEDPALATISPGRAPKPGETGQASGVVGVDAGGELLLLVNGSLLTLSPEGAWAWNQFHSPRRESDLVAELVNSGRLSTEESRGFQDLVDELVHTGVLDRCHA
ncbi:hypothetical protein CATRI_11835 [Corynebacterium atrinae]|nr:hypothetical protein CATRI_11835 [Corynebacterium atrinae]